MMVRSRLRYRAPGYDSVTFFAGKTLSLQSKLNVIEIVEWKTMEETSKKDYVAPDTGVFCIRWEGVICASVMRENYPLEEW